MSSEASSGGSASDMCSSAHDRSPPTRKRKRRVQQWTKSKRKALRNSGKEYTSATKKKVFCAGLGSLLHGVCVASLPCYLSHIT